MPPSRTLTTLAAALLGGAVAGAGAWTGTVDVVLEPPMAPDADVRIALDGVSSVVEGVEPAQPPGLVAVAVDAGWNPAGGAGPEAEAERVVAALGGSTILLARITDHLELRGSPALPSPDLARTLAAVLAEPLPGTPYGGSNAAVVAAIHELRAAGGTATATVEVEGLRRRAEAHAAACRLGALRRIAALEELVRRLAAVPGRTSVVLIADELETVPGAGIAAAWREAFPDMPSRALEAVASSRDVERALAALEGLSCGYRVAFYPVAATGAFGARLAAATGGLVVGPDDLAAAAEPAHRVRFAVGGPAEPRSGLLSAARSDGGSARAPGRWLPVEPLPAMVDRTLGAATLGLAENPLEVEASPQEPRLREDGTLLVPILVTVPVARLALEAGEGLHRGRVSVLAAVAGGGPPAPREFPLEIPREALEQAVASRAGFVVGVIVEPGRHLAAVGLCDLLASSWSTVLVPISVTSGDTP